MSGRVNDFAHALLLAKRQNRSTCGLVAMTSAPHAEGRQFDPGQVYRSTTNQYTCVSSRKLLATKYTARLHVMSLCASRSSVGAVSGGGSERHSTEFKPQSCHHFTPAQSNGFNATWRDLTRGICANTGRTSRYSFRDACAFDRAKPHSNYTAQ